MTTTSPETPALIGIDNDDKPAAAIPIPSLSTMVSSITGLFLGNKNSSHPHSWPFPTATRTSATAPASPYDVTITTPGLTMSPARPISITMAIIPTRTAPSPSSDFLDSHVQGFDRLVFQCVCVSFIVDVSPFAGTLGHFGSEL